MPNSFLRKSYTYVNEKGFYSLMQLGLMRLRLTKNGLLQRKYGFNVWHINPYSERPYAKAIVAYLNNRLIKDSVLEIGCGLGDILRRLDFKDKTGLDYEQEVLNAAEFIIKFQNMGKGRVRYRNFDILKDELDGKYDIIIMVNWIHEIPPYVLAEKFKVLFNAHLNPGGELLFDVLDNPDYKFNHSPVELTSNLKADLTLIGHFEYNRHVYSARKPKHIVAI